MVAVRRSRCNIAGAKAWLENEWLEARLCTKGLSLPEAIPLSPLTPADPRWYSSSLSSQPSASREFFVGIEHQN